MTTPQFSHPGTPAPLPPPPWANSPASPPTQFPTTVPGSAATPTAPAPPPADESTTTPPPVVSADSSERLDQLTAQWWAAKQAADEAEKLAKELSNQVKTETLRQAPEGSTDVILRSSHLPCPYRVARRETRRFDTKGFRAADPQTWARWTKPHVEWRLDPMK